MMQDLAMHMLEIIMNSIHADSKNIEIEIRDSDAEDLIAMSIKDDGKGMSKTLLTRVADPFTTSRSTRKIGMGVPFMKGLTQQCAGTFDMTSEPGVGTTLNATVQKSHIDRPPMGDIGEMMMHAIQADEGIDFILTYTKDDGEFRFSTTEVKEELDGISLREPEILLWIRDYINQEI